MTSLAPRRAAPSAATEPSVIDFCFFFMGLFVGLFGAGASARARAARLAAPRRGARPPVIVPRRPGAAPVPPSSSRGASSPSTRVPPTPWRVAPACSPPRPRRCHPMGSPKSVPPRPNPTGTSSAASPGSARGRATANPRRRRPRIGRETALRGGPSCGSPYGPNYKVVQIAPSADRIPGGCKDFVFVNHGVTR